MSGVRQAMILGGIPVIVGVLYLVLQLALGEPITFDALGLISGTIDPAGVVLLVALGLGMGFGMLVILRGARDI